MTRDEMTTLLRTSRTIAVVGLSEKPERASYRVAAYLQSAGYRIIPVRPQMNRPILGEECYPTLEAIPSTIKVDIVDVFRRAEEVLPVAESAVAIGARAFWLQSGIINDQALEVARGGGLLAIQDRCLMVEHRGIG